MGKINIVNWNSQGGAATQNKGNALADNLSAWNQDGQDCIVFLEEAGVPGGTGFSEGQDYNMNGVIYKCIAACVDPKAQNQRCTVSVLIQETMLDGNDVELGYLEQGAYRLVPFVIFNNQIVFAGMHAIANFREAPQEVSNIIRHLDRDENGQKRMPWILMGDFNSAPSSYPLGGEVTLPDRVNRIRYDGTYSRPQYCNMIYSSQNTQGANGRRDNNYDYAFMQESISNITAFDNVIVHDAYNNVLSDHNMIRMEVTI